MLGVPEGSPTRIPEGMTVGTPDGILGVIPEENPGAVTGKN